MASSAEVVQRALNAWGLYTQEYERFALLHEALIGSSPGVYDTFLASLERWIQDERMHILESYWGDVSKATPQQAEFVTVPAATMVRLNGIVGHYGINRVFLFLYVHAYLWDRVLKGGPLGVLDDLVRELDPR